MSAGGSPIQKGPRETRIDQLWTAAWKALEEGGVFEPYVALAESELANYNASLVIGDVAAQSDLRSAQNLHLFQSRHFSVRLNKLETARQVFSKITDWLVVEIGRANEHAVRALYVANGGIVLATLTYVQARNEFQLGFLWVIALGSLGYLLTLLGCHLTVLFGAKAFGPLAKLVMPRIAVKEWAETHKLVQFQLKRTRWTAQPAFYLAGACLVAALTIGVATLTSTRQVARHAENKTSVLLRSDADSGSFPSAKPEAASHKKIESAKQHSVSPH